MEQSEHRPAEAEPRSLRTYLIHRPREGCSSAGAELNILVQAAALASLRQRNCVPSVHIRCRMTARRRAKATIAFLPPRRRATCIPQALSQDHFLGTCEEHLRCLVECRPHHGVPTLRDPPVVVRFAGLKAARYQADMRADRPGMDKTLRLVDRRTVGQRYHCARSHVIMPISVRHWKIRVC